MSHIFSSDHEVVQHFNERYAQIIVGDDVQILEEMTSENGQRDIRLLKDSAFRKIHAEKMFAKKKATAIWSMHPERRKYDGFTFEPSKGVDVDGKYNLWFDFAMKPSPQGCCNLLLRHIKANVCQGDEELYHWLMCWFADILQNPLDLKGTVVIFTGGQGSGKSIVMQVMGQLLGRHYKHFTSAGQALSNFNDDMKDALLVGIDEGRFVGSYKFVDKLKAQVVSKTISIEPKGVDRFVMPHYARYMMTSNASTVVRDDADSRRFAMFHVGNNCKGNTSFFDGMMKELEQGGYAFLLYKLLNWNIDVDLRRVPQTEALLSQKLDSLPPLEKWLHERLFDGEVMEGRSWCSQVSSKDWYEDFSLFFEKLKYRNVKPTPTKLGRFLRQALPSIKRKQLASGRVYQLPSLAEARKHFDIYCSTEWEWLEESCVEPIVFRDSVSE